MTFGGELCFILKSSAQSTNKQRKWVFLFEKSSRTVLGRREQKRFRKSPRTSQNLVLMKYQYRLIVFIKNSFRSTPLRGPQIHSLRRESSVFGGILVGSCLKIMTTNTIAEPKQSCRNSGICRWKRAKETAYSPKEEPVHLWQSSFHQER